MSTTTIPTALAHDIAARLCQEADTAARELRTRLIACMAAATSPGASGEVDLWAECDREPSFSQPGLAVVRPHAETSEWRANIEVDNDAEQGEPPEFKPVAGPLGLAIFVDGEHAEDRDGHAAPRKGDVICVGESRCMVMLVEWRSMETVHVHTTWTPSVGGGPF